MCICVCPCAQMCACLSMPVRACVCVPVHVCMCVCTHVLLRCAKSSVPRRQKHSSMLGLRWIERKCLRKLGNRLIQMSPHSFLTTQNGINFLPNWKTKPYINAFIEYVIQSLQRSNPSINELFICWKSVMISIKTNFISIHLPACPMIIQINLPL